VLPSDFPAQNFGVTAMKAALTTLAILSYASFIWGSLFFFDRDGKSRILGRLLSITWLSGMAVHLYCLIVLPTLRLPAMLSIGLYALSLFIFWSAIRSATDARLEAIFNSTSADRLVQSGIYSRIRHPFYSAYLLSWIAGGLASGTALAWFFVLIVALQYAIAIHLEETQLLAGPLKEEYAAYRSSVGMLLPIHFGRFLKRRSPEFS